MMQGLHLERTATSRALSRPQGQHGPTPGISVILLGFHQPPTDEPTPRGDKADPEQCLSGIGILSLFGPFVAGLPCARAFRVRTEI
jgi:hypothetical protein